MKVTVNKREYQVIEEPDRHIVVPTRKELHGWWPGKRECSAERMLINPYNGCGIGCFFCYSLAFPGNFQIFREKGVVVVAKKDWKLKDYRRWSRMQVNLGLAVNGVLGRETL